jgi:hypothetical protein
VLLFAWGLEPGRLPYRSSDILKALAKLDSMLSKLARVTEERPDEQKNVVDNQDHAPQSAGRLQPTPPIELPPDSPAPPGSAASAATAQPPQPEI